MGRRVVDLELDNPISNGVKIKLDNPEQYEELAPADSLIPVHISGRVLRVIGNDLPDLAITINGTIQAVTRTYIDWYANLDQSELRFTAMVPEAAIEGRSIEVDIFVINGSPGAARLEPMFEPAKKRKPNDNKKRRR